MLEHSMVEYHVSEEEVVLYAESVAFSSQPCDVDAELEAHICGCEECQARLDEVIFRIAEVRAAAQRAAERILESYGGPERLFEGEAPARNGPEVAVSQGAVDVPAPAASPRNAVRLRLGSGIPSRMRLPRRHSRWIARGSLALVTVIAAVAWGISKRNQGDTTSPPVAVHLAPAQLPEVEPEHPPREDSTLVGEQGKSIADAAGMAPTGALGEERIIEVGRLRSFPRAMRLGIRESERRRWSARTTTTLDLPARVVAESIFTKLDPLDKCQLLQTILAAQDFYPGHLIDGKAGEEFRLATLEFQRRVNDFAGRSRVREDGAMGPETIKEIFDSVHGEILRIELASAGGTGGDGTTER